MAPFRGFAPDTLAHCMAENQPSMPINVMIVGDVRLFRDGLATTLHGRRDIAVVATSSGDAGTLARVRALAPNVVIIDVQSSELVEFVQLIRTDCPSVRIVAFAINDTSDTLLQCAQAGVSGYVTSEAGIDDLVGMIYTVMREEFACSPEITTRLLRRLAARGEKSEATVAESTLTARERQVLALICDGLSNKEIARACSISEATVKNHVHHLLEKRGLRTRGQLAALAGLESAVRSTRRG
jgi:two-component system nitrate/nitrite response regulator NarL